MSAANSDANQDPDAAREDFRATAAAFSTLTGVLGGFCITILVLVLQAGSIGGHGRARDVDVFLVLLAALVYVASSGFLANATNSPTFRKLCDNMKKNGKPVPDNLVSALQDQAFTLGIVLFYIGNAALAVALIILVVQFSLVLGVAAAGVITLFVLVMGAVNLGGMRFLGRGWP